MTERKNYLLQNERLLDYHSKLSELKDTEEMLDVTLASDDYSIVKAHKVVISAASTFFRNIIKISGNQNPFIYIKGVTAEDLDSIINFIYTGEAKVPTENINRFMEAAKDLKIDGLVNVENEKEPMIEVAVNVENVKEPMIEVTENNQFKRLKSPIKIRKNKKVRKNKISKTNSSSQLQLPSANLEETICKEEGALEATGEDAENVFEYALSQKYVKDKEDGKTVYNCTDCEKKYFTRQKVKFHVEGHLDGRFVHNCNLCGTQLKTKKSFEMHKLKKHSKSRAMQLMKHNQTF